MIYLILFKYWFVLAIGLLSCFLIFKKPILGLALFAALIPLEELTAINPSFTMVKLFGFLTLIAWIFHLIKFRQKIKTNNVFWMLLLFFSWASFSSLWAINRNLSLSRIPMLIQLSGLYLLCINLIKTRKGLNLVLGSFLAGSIVAGLVCLFNIYTKPLWMLDLNHSNIVFFISTCRNQNIGGFAKVMGLGLLFGLLFLDETKRWFPRISLIVISSLFILLIGRGLNRGTWVALPLAWLSQISLGKFRFKETFFVLLLTTFVIFAGLKTNFLPKGGYYSMSKAALSIINPDVTTSAIIKKIIAKFEKLTKREQVSHPILNEFFGKRYSGRIDIWKVGWEMIKANPILGVGLRNFTIAYNIYSPKVKNLKGIFFSAGPHSDLVDITAETGIIGLSLFLFIFILTYQAIRKEGRDRNSIYAVILLAFVFFSGFSTTDHYLKSYWLILAISYLLPRLKNEDYFIDKNISLGHC